MVTKRSRTRQSKIQTITGFGKQLKTIARKSDDSLIRTSEQSVVDFLDSLRRLPKEHNWRIDGSVFNEIIKDVQDGGELNKRYWGSVCNDIEGIAIQTNFRGEELVQPLPRLLESGNINASATISRSLLELAASFLSTANTIIAATDSILKGLSDNKVDVKTTPYVCAELVDDILVKASFGTRYEPALSAVDNKQREVLTQRNVLTRIDKLSKHPHAHQLRPNYDFLCELAHPNSMGYQRFWSEIEDDLPGILVRISRKVPKVRTIETTEKCLWALSWGTIAIVNSTELCNESIEKLRLHLVNF